VASVSGFSCREETNVKNPILFACAVAAIGVACDVAVDGAYRGTPLFSIEGSVRVELSTQDLGRTPSGTLRVALFWSSADTLTESLNITGEEQDVETTGAFPARYALTLYEPPLDRLISNHVGASGSFAYASLMAYVDENNDGRWDRGQEPLVGGAFDRVLIYAPNGVSAPGFGMLAPGYHLLAREEGVELCPEDEPESELELIPITEPDTQITVNVAFPLGAILDLDCQGLDWAMGCPAFDEIRTRCEVSTPTDAMLCAQCTQLLAPQGAGSVACNQWTRSCYLFDSTAACHDERFFCLEGQPAAAGYVCEEDLCQCQSTRESCVGAGGETVTCSQQADVCFAEAAEDG
jgi:hypothetical protein